MSNRGLALVTEHVGCGSFYKIPFADGDEFLTGQWAFKASVGDELALFQRYGNPELSFANGTILHIIPSGSTAGEQPNQRFTFLVQLDREKFVKRQVALSQNGNLVRVGKFYDLRQENYSPHP